MFRKKLLHFVTNYLVRHLLKAVTIEDVLRIEKTAVFIGKRKLTSEEISALREDADALVDSDLWRYMTKEVRWHAQLRMFEQATVPEDLLYGKAMLYNLELMRKFMDGMRNL